ncbi:type VII secretion system-associated protein [Nocardia sp. NPDC051570]|uniref:type VII secretion system-associated protein n=1 Tax=Nocardia sp. NPDC051570 TaxID=3364324 RepID=UPI0037898548
MNNYEIPLPPITDELRREAARNPGGWVYVIDPFFDRDGAVPPHGVEGGWKVDERGELTEFQKNAKYRPSPARLQLPPPENKVEAAAQLAATGYGSEADLNAALMVANVYVVANANEDIMIYTDLTGDFVAIFSSPGKISTENVPVVLMPFSRLISRMPENVAISLNPTSSVEVRLPASTLAEIGTDIKD